VLKQSEHSEGAAWEKIQSGWKNCRPLVTPIVFYLLAGFLVWIAFRLAVTQKMTAENGRTILYLLLGAAGVILALELIPLFPRLIKAKIGGTEIELEQKVDDLEERIRKIMKETQGGTSAKSMRARLDAEEKNS
jgi:hypothetical protein